MPDIVHSVQHQNDRHQILFALVLTLAPSKLVCSVAMSPCKEYFQYLNAVEGATITGIAGGIVATVQGTICFNVEDGKDQIQAIKPFGSLYIPNLPQTLLCPQHWAQLDNDDGTYIKNTSTGCWLVWNRERSRNLFPWIPKQTHLHFLLLPAHSTIVLLKQPSWPVMHQRLIYGTI
jgi:hypothetical protein